MEEKYSMRYCKICAENKNDSFGMKYHVPGYIDESVFSLKDNKCLMGHDTIQLNMPCEDYQILTHISTDSKFMGSMVKLYDSDPIDYQLKMSQFRTQIEQQESSKAQNDATPRCPTCGSTNIKPISVTERATSIIGLGIFSKKINKTYKCLNCKCTW